MIYKALVTRIDENIEEEIDLTINDINFTGFASILPYELTQGKSYNVSVGFFVIDDIEPKELLNPIQEVVRINENKYPYILRGVLNENGNLDVGFELNDDDNILKKYEFLFNKYVEIIVDRISVDFLACRHSPGQ